MLQEELLNTYHEIDKAIEKAPDSPVPFPVVKDEKMTVVGDANETQINDHDFKITFRFPKGSIDGENDEVVKVVEYNNVFISPRQCGKVVASYCKLLPFFVEVGEKGERRYTPDELKELLAKYGDDLVDNLYDLVAKVLNIDSNLVNFMTLQSVMDASIKITNNYPEVVNEAEAFFS